MLPKLYIRKIDNKLMYIHIGIPFFSKLGVKYFQHTTADPPPLTCIIPCILSHFVWLNKKCKLSLYADFLAQSS